MRPCGLRIIIAVLTMSRIHDFDEFLKAQSQSRQKALNERQKRLFSARQKYDNLIGDTFVLLRDYHEKIILPRLSSFLVVKRKEDLAGESDKPIRLMYRANLIPKDFLPPAFDRTDLIRRVDYLTPYEITENDWHANVALQFTLALESTPDENAEIALNASVRTWGHLTPDNDTPLTHGIKMTHEIDRRIPYTDLTLTGTQFPEQSFIQEVETILIVLTPSVLSHREAVWKKD